MAGETQSAELSDFDSIIGQMDTAVPTDDEPEATPDEAPDEKPELTDEGEAPEGVEKPEGEADDEEDDLTDDDETPAKSTPDGELAAKWKALEEGDELPEDLLEKLVTAKNGDRTWKIPVKEALQSYQRLNESTRRSQELDQREQHIKQNEQQLGQFFESIKDPNNFLEVFERQLGPDVLDQALTIRAQRLQEDQDFVEAAGYACMRRHGITDPNDPRVRQAMEVADRQNKAARMQDIERRRIEARARQLDAQQQQQTQQKSAAEVQARVKNQLDQMVPMAFKALKVRDNPRNRNELITNLRAVLQQSGQAEITREAVLQAARILREDLEDKRDASAPKKPAEAKDKPRGKQGAGAGAAPTRGQSQADRAKPRMLSEWDDVFGS